MIGRPAQSIKRQELIDITEIEILARSSGNHDIHGNSMFVSDLSSVKSVRFEQIEFYYFRQSVQSEIGSRFKKKKKLVLSLRDPGYVLNVSNTECNSVNKSKRF